MVILGSFPIGIALGMRRLVGSASEWWANGGQTSSPSRWLRWAGRGDRSGG